MKITRIGDKRHMHMDAARIEIEVNGKNFVLTEAHDGLEVQVSHDELLVKPGYANVVTLGANDR